MSEAPDFTLAQQADAVEYELLTRRNLCATIHDQIKRGRRPQTDLTVASGYIPALEAAAATLRRAADRQAAKAKEAAA